MTNDRAVAVLRTLREATQKLWVEIGRGTCKPKAEYDAAIALLMSGEIDAAIADLVSLETI